MLTIDAKYKPIFESIPLATNTHAMPFACIKLSIFEISVPSNTPAPTDLNEARPPPFRVCKSKHLSFLKKAASAKERCYAIQTSLHQALTHLNGALEMATKLNRQEDIAK
ncbi:MAG: hypothetical protein EOO68_14535, partial [Moraxellaceae bacterium]